MQQERASVGDEKKRKRGSRAKYYQEWRASKKQKIDEMAEICKRVAHLEAALAVQEARNAELVRRNKHLWKKAVALRTENEWLWDARDHDEEHNKQLRQEVERLQAALRASTTTSAQLAAYIEDSPLLTSPIQKRICENAAAFLHRLGPTHPFRRSIIYNLGQGLSTREVAAALQFSTRTLQRARSEAGQPLARIRYPLHTERDRLGEDNRSLLIHTIDEILPVRSGRPWRLQRQTNQRLYHQYSERVQASGHDPLSFSTVMRHLSSLSIHHDNRMKFCPHCHNVAMSPPQGAPDEELGQDWSVWHHQHAPRQERRYLLEKRLVACGQLLSVYLVVQDFSRFETESGLKFQVLIIARYSHSPSAPDGLERRYRLFVGQQQDKVPGHQQRFEPSCAWLMLRCFTEHC
jgi:hypothetical protein